MQGRRRPWLQLWLTRASCLHLGLASRKQKNRARKLVCLLLISLLSLLIFTCLCLWQGLLRGGVNAPALPMGSSRAQEAKNVAVLVPVRRDVKALVRRVAILEGEHAQVHRA
jgi:hypothetical protein